MTQQTEAQAADRDETHDLISSEKVDGTAVYNQKGDKVGSIHHFMVGKRNGRVEYAVMTFGGLFGLGERYYPLPWDALNYNKEKHGYVVDLDEEKIENAPYYDQTREPLFDRLYGQSIYGYYGFPY